MPFHPLSHSPFLSALRLLHSAFEMIPRELFKKIRRVEVRTRGLVDELFGGEYHTAFKGRGIEFAEVRPYQIGDEIRTIDWNVSARTGEPYVKLFHEEREQTLLLVVDVSGSESFGSTTLAKRDLAAEICAVLGFSALRNDDKVGLLMFSDRIERYVAPKKGKRHVLRLLRDLFAHEPRGTGTNLSAALERALRLLHRRAIVVVVSDFLDSNFERPLRMLSGRHDVVAVRTVDPREEEIPSVGLVTTHDPESGNRVVIDTTSKSAREAFTSRSARRTAAINTALQQAHVDTFTVRTDEDYAESLASFFRRRNRHRR